MFKSEVMKSRQCVRPSRLNTPAPEIAACCQIMQRNLHVVKPPGDLPSMLRAGYKSIRRLRKEMLNCHCVFEVPRLHLLSPDSNDNEQYACLAAPIADFSGLSSRILKSYCVNRFSAGLGVAGLINVQGEGGGVAMARITRQPLQAWRQFWLHCGSYARVLSELQGHFLFKMTEQKAFFLRSGFWQ